MDEKKNVPQLLDDEMLEEATGGAKQPRPELTPITPVRMEAPVKVMPELDPFGQKTTI